MHRIRLRAPWQIEWQETGLNSSPVLVARRRFHRPATNLADERVFLAAAGLLSATDVRLNGRDLGRFEVDRASTAPEIPLLEITAVWEQSNQLELAFRDADPQTPPATENGPAGEVWIEFRPH